MEKAKENVCAFCHKPGPEWVLRRGDKADPVHHGCGKRLVHAAPKGQEAKLEPGRALRKEWIATAKAKAFWAELGKEEGSGRKVVDLQGLQQKLRTA